ncbi:helix-turn-helix domain-containing protein [Bacillota bacterium LX-D]|nr:helix-turn-helix domain-containing protein [Bacillota bacterium LX-D]
MNEQDNIFKIITADHFIAEEEMTPSQKKIAQAALKLFAEKGYEASSTSAIAKEAGVAEGTIYKYYKSKKDLMLSLIAPMVIRLAGPVILRDVVSITQNKERSSVELLEELFLNRLKLIENNTEVFKIILQQVMFHPELKTALVSHIAVKGKKLLSDFLQRKVDEGEFRDVGIEHMTLWAVSLMAGYIFAKQLFTEESTQWNDKKAIKSLVDIYIHGIENKK